MAHTCDAIVISCMDFRFEKFIRNWTDTSLSGKLFDRVAYAGSTKELDTIMKQIDISVRLHHITEAILIHHEECGAYGAESTPERHEHDLRDAKATILAKYPGLSVELYYLTLDGTFNKVE